MLSESAAWSCFAGSRDRPSSCIEKPPVSEAITVLQDLRYREGPSKQWRLDLAMKKDLERQTAAGLSW